ncbi:hypothetical protein VPH35_068487 [Triticum aestivum]
MAKPIPNWQGMGCHASWFSTQRPRTLPRLHEGRHEADSGDAGQRQRWADHHYVAPAQATSNANTAEVHEDDDDLQIVAQPAMQARRRPPPIIVIDEDEEEEEVEVQPNPTQLKQEVRRSERLAGQTTNFSKYCAIYVMLSMVPPM